MTGGMRGSPKLPWRGAAAVIRTLEQPRMGLISVTRHISKSVALLWPEGVDHRRRAPAALGAGVKFNALGINRFAMKRPFATLIIYMVRCTKVARVPRWGGGGLYLTDLQLRLPNLLDRVVGVTTELGWCSSPALNGRKSGLSAPYTVPEQQTE
jgi:hypothetical protein